MKPLVSILIPAYNAEACMAATVESALAQTWPRKEVIVVDDGSQDQTVAIANRYAGPGVLVHTHENQGAAATRNKAFSLCQGDFIQWLDADDLLGPDKVALQMQAWEESRSDRILLSSAWGRFYHAPDRAHFRETSLWRDLSPVEWLVRKLGENVFMQTGVWLVSRTLSDEAGSWDTRLLSDDDGEYFSRVLLRSEHVRFVRDAKVFYRAPGPASLSYLGASRRKMEALLLSMKLHVETLRAHEDSDRVRTACLRYLQDGLPNFDPAFPDLVDELHQIAAGLGGQLASVRRSWKYRALKSIAGHDTAARAQLRYDIVRTSLERGWDRLMLSRSPRGKRRADRNGGSESMPLSQSGRS